MNLGELIVAILASIGGSAVVLAGLATFLGKVWIKRIEQRDKIISDAKFKYYIGIWESLCEVEIIGNKLWDKASKDNISDFVIALENARAAINRGRIILSVNHYCKLSKLITSFEDYRIGKDKISEMRVSSVLDDISRGDFQGDYFRQSNINQGYKEEYELLLVEILDDFKRQLGFAG